MEPGQALATLVPAPAKVYDRICRLVLPADRGVGPASVEIYHPFT